MSEFKYKDMFPLGEDKTEYKLLTKDHVSVKSFEGNDILMVSEEGLKLITYSAFKDVAHLYRTTHMESLKKIIDDPESSENDKYIATEMIKNAVISAEMIFPMCQDTGTATVVGYKGQNVWTGFDDKKLISEGVFDCYTKNFLRYSQNAALTMYDEQNTKSNLPAQIDLFASKGDEYNFLFVAKGGGSANKTSLFQ